MPELIKESTSLSEQINKNRICVVHFSAEWAEQCKQVDDLLDTIAKQEKYAKVAFLKCQAEDLSELSLKYKVEAVPTVILFKTGTLADRVDGINTAQVAEKLKTLVDSDSGASEGVSLEDRLKALINKGNVMLFMKGDRKQPRCGFSRQMIDILNETKVDYETFDILSDEEVRQGLKTYSDWPTYPQLYVKGELIGGLDIVKETLAAGELVQTLNG